MLYHEAYYYAERKCMDPQTMPQSTMQPKRSSGKRFVLIALGLILLLLGGQGLYAQVTNDSLDLLPAFVNGTLFLAGGAILYAAIKNKPIR